MHLLLPILGLTHGAATCSERLGLLTHIHLLLHTGSTPYDSCRVLLNQFLRKNGGLFLYGVPLRGIGLDVTITLEAASHLMLTLHLHVAINSLIILLKHQKLLHLLKLVQRGAVAALLL